MNMFTVKFTVGAEFGTKVLDVRAENAEAAVSRAKEIAQKLKMTDISIVSVENNGDAQKYADEMRKGRLD